MSISASLELESPSKKERKINIFNELWTICVGNYLLVIYRIAFRLTFWRCGRCAYASVPRYRCRRSLLMVWVGYGTTRTDCGWRRDMVNIWYLISVMSTSHINIHICIYTYLYHHEGKVLSFLVARLLLKNWRQSVRAQIICGNCSKPSGHTTSQCCEKKRGGYSFEFSNEELQI